MVDQNIQTTIDALVTYVNEHGESNIVTVANALGVGEQTIVEWSNILEKANILKIVYKSGKMYLAPVGTTGTTLQQVKQEQQAEKSHLEIELSSQMAAVNAVSSKITEFNKTLDDIDNVFKTKYKDIKPVLDRVNAIEAEMNNSSKRIKAKSDDISNMHTKLKADFDGMEKYSIDIEKFNVDTNNATSVMNDIKKNIASYKENIQQLQKDFDKATEERKKTAQQLISQMTEGTKELEQILAYDQKQLAQYGSSQKSFKSDAEASMKNLKKDRAVAMDEINKSGQKTAQLLSTFSKQTGDLQTKIDELKKSIGFAADLNDKLNAIKTQLAAAQQQKDKLSNDLSKMLQTVRALGALDTGKASNKSNEMDKVQRESKKTGGLVNSLKSTADEINKKIGDLGK
jgi:chromosome segregation ATPase